MKTGRIGVIGAGSIGGTLARCLAKLGHQVSIANSRGPESLTALAAEIGATPVSVVDAAKAGEIVIIAIPTKAVADLPRGLFANVPGSVVVVDTGNYHPELRDGRIDAIDLGMLDSQWVAQQIGRDQGVQQYLRQKPSRERRSEGTPGRIALSVVGDSVDAKAARCALSTILASTRSTVVNWTHPGGSSPERRRTAGILNPRLSGARSPKLTGAGSPIPCRTGGSY
jgi:8-hydroxy-5-deazaflavin:NADPH oxidoreductase